MKKLLMMALLVIAATSAYAQDDALKSILKVKTYDDAQKLLKSKEASMTAWDKAEAYNHLVDIAYDEVQNVHQTMTQNQLNIQLKQKVQPFDTAKYYNAVYNSINDGIYCDKFDQQPNKKGKIKPSFHEANQKRLYNLRPELINAGQAAKNDRAEALKNFSLYIESYSAPLFKEVDKVKNHDQYLGEVARVASAYAFESKDMDKANRYIDIALQDTASYKEALNLKLYYMQQNLKTRQDSIDYCNKLKQIYEKDKSNEQIFGTLASILGNLGPNEKAEQKKLVSDKLAENPNNFMAWALKGQVEMNESKWDDAIASYKKAVSIDDKNALILTYLGFSINSKAATIENNKTEQMNLIKESMGYLEKARDADPNREKANWCYPLYQCYYAVYGANDSRTKEMEAMTKR
jgi:hypothetical protein